RKVRAGTSRRAPSRVCSSAIRVGRKQSSPRRQLSRRRSWMSSLLQTRASPRHGRGVFATGRIPRGTRVAVLGGDILLIDEIHDLSERMAEFTMQIEERFVLGNRDADEPEDADFFNHSCDPNCGFKGQIFLVTIRDVEEGEELTFDYAMVVSESV